MMPATVCPVNPDSRRPSDVMAVQDATVCTVAFPDDHLLIISSDAIPFGINGPEQEAGLFPSCKCTIIRIKVLYFLSGFNFCLKI
jgi:hypothetical protein